MASREKDHTIPRWTAGASLEEATDRPEEGVPSPAYLYPFTAVIRISTFAPAGNAATA
jgi:hypothetical protein